MSGRKDPTVPMSDDMLESIDSRLEYGDSRAEWIREAIRQRLRAEADDGPPEEKNSDQPADA